MGHEIRTDTLRCRTYGVLGSYPRPLIMSHPLEQQVIRAAMALCALAVRSQEADVRDDMRDEVAALLRLWVRVSAGPDLRRWAERMDRYLSVLATQSNQPLDAILAAHTATLRIRVALPVPVVAVKKLPSVMPPVRIIRESHPQEALQPRIGRKHDRVLEFVRQHPGIRTTALVEGLVPGLSPRTIKRCLKDLTDRGALTRMKVEGAVSYRAD